MIINIDENDPRDPQTICRVWRDTLLMRSDWAMTPDAPTDKTAWAAYRQALRDFPATWKPGPIIEFPDAPQS